MDTSYNMLDFALVALLGLFLIRGLVRGFVKEVVGLVGVVAALALGALFYQPVSEFLSKLTGLEVTWWPAVAFGLILVVVAGAFFVVGGGLSKLILSGPLSGLDRLLGAGVGLVKGLLVAYLLINLLLLALPFQAPETIKGSTAAPYVVRGGRYFMDLFPDDLMRKLQERSGLLPPSAAELTSPAPTPGAPEKANKETP